MKEIGLRVLMLGALLGAGIALFSLNHATTLAVEGGRYELGWYAVGFGGGESAGGNYEMRSTVGQADADELNGGAYSLGSGFGGGKRVVAPVTPTPIPTATAIAIATATATATPGALTATATPTITPTPWKVALSTATPTATATQVGEPSPTATATPTKDSAPTATPTPLGNTNEAAKLYLPLLRR